MSSPPKRYRDMTTPELVDWAVSQSKWEQGMLIYALAQRLKEESRGPRTGKPHISKMKGLWGHGVIGKFWVCRGPAGVSVYGPTPVTAYTRWKGVMSRDVYQSIKARSS